MSTSPHPTRAITPCTTCTAFHHTRWRLNGHACPRLTPHAVLHHTQPTALAGWQARGVWQGGSLLSLVGRLLLPCRCLLKMPALPMLADAACGCFMLLTAADAVILPELCCCLLRTAAPSTVNCSLQVVDKCGLELLQHLNGVSVNNERPLPEISISKAVMVA